MRKLLVSASIAACVATGCSSGPIEPLPPLRAGAIPASVVVQREKSVVGLPATMFFSIDGKRIYAAQIGQAFTFEIDPGEYIFGYELGFNKCSQRVIIRQGRRYFLLLRPVCDIELKDLSLNPNPVYARPLDTGSAAYGAATPAYPSTSAAPDAAESRELWLD
jgi:hypothetical protein